MFPDFSRQSESSGSSVEVFLDHGLVVVQVRILMYHGPASLTQVEQTANLPAEVTGCIAAFVTTLIVHYVRTDFSPFVHFSESQLDKLFRQSLNIGVLVPERHAPLALGILQVRVQVQRAVDYTTELCIHHRGQLRRGHRSRDTNKVDRESMVNVLLRLPRPLRVTQKPRSDVTRFVLEGETGEEHEVVVFVLQTRLQHQLHCCLVFEHKESVAFRWVVVLVLRSARPVNYQTSKLAKRTHYLLFFDIDWQPSDKDFPRVDFGARN